MKKPLIPLAAVILALVATSAGVLALTGSDTPIRSDEGIDPNECNLVHNIAACDQDDLDRLGGGDLLPVNPDAGSDDPCEPLPLRSDCGIDPNVSDFPAEVVNSWGVTTFQGYLDIDRRQTTDHPYGPLGGGMTIFSLPLDKRVGESQAIVVGTVIDISPAYFNSVDGGFWHEPSSVAGRSILQDVTIEVERVLGDTAGLTGVGSARKESIVVTIAGGQIEVTFDESVDPALLPEGHEPGRTYVQGSAPHVEVAEGDRVLVILHMEVGPWFGAPVDPEMPWGRTSYAGCPILPLGTKSVVFGDWYHLGTDSQQITVEGRTVTFGALEALADAGLGQLLTDAAAPISPGNGLPAFDDPPPGPCYTPHPPTQLSEPVHIHPGYED